MKLVDLRQICESNKSLYESLTYESFWLSPEGEVSKWENHRLGAFTILNRDKTDDRNNSIRSDARSIGWRDFIITNDKKLWLRMRWSHLNKMQKKAIETIVRKYKLAIKEGTEMDPENLGAV